MVARPLPTASVPVADRVVHLIQGEHKVTDDPCVVISTILGSCVAACIRDPLAGIGGMNHFLLPGASPNGDRTAVERTGVHAMELLVNALLNRGAQRQRMEVKLFGGAKTVFGLSDVGAQNASFARAFVQRERLMLVGECLLGLRGRRLQFWPVSGRARRIFMAPTEQVHELPVKAQPASATAGDLELF